MKIRDNTNNIFLPAKVFTGGVLVYLLAVLPFLIDRKGLFFYYGDYNVQQVPFLIFAHRAVRSGRVLWNPLVDLGGNMTGSFAFYLWGSPFFWLTIPFPESWLPYMTPWLMALKFGTAAAASCMWIRTQTRSDKAAVLGAFLYAFSGFQACNIVFQHFHDVTAFFPLYLLAFDRFVTGSRRAWDRGFPDLCAGESGSGRRRAEGLLGFTLMTALMSVINYYFFFGQVLFFVLYYMVRWGIRRARASGVKALAAEILRILAAGTAGLLLSSFFLVQSVAGIMGNTRVSKVINGYDLLVYPDSVTPLAILKSFFMVPDLIARGTLFTNDNIRNGSLAFYLPCFAMAGVFAYWILRRRSWKKTLVTVLADMAFVPVLNASFSAFRLQLQFLHALVRHAHPSVCLYDSGGTGRGRQHGLYAGDTALPGMYGTLSAVLLSSGGRRRQMVLYVDLRKQKSSDKRDHCHFVRICCPSCDPLCQEALRQPFYQKDSCRPGDFPGRRACSTRKSCRAGRKMPVLRRKRVRGSKTAICFSHEGRSARFGAFSHDMFGVRLRCPELY